MSVVLDVGGKPVDTLPYFENAPFVAVAGGTGFIGSHVVHCLLEHGYKIVCITRGQRRNGPSDDNIIFNNNLIYLDHDLCSAALTATLVESLKNCVAIVNLVGIKMEKNDQTFENVHIGVVKRLLEISAKIQVKRFIHVSVLCARPDAQSGYHDTKFRSEELIKASSIPYTILKPSVVYGKGDDMVTSLAGVIRTSPLFPLIGNGSSLHQPILVTDLALALVECLNSENTIGKSYELVGPTKVTTKEMVHIVADGMGLPTVSFAFPIALHKIAAEVGTKLLPNPPATPTQLKMLIEGMTGDANQIRMDLDMPKLCTSVLAPNVVQQFESQIPPIAGFSLRLLSSHSHYAWLESHRSLLKNSSILLAVAAFMMIFSMFFENSVVGVALFYIIACGTLIILMKNHLRWRIEMIQPPPPSIRLQHAALGLAFGFLLCIFVKYFFIFTISDWHNTAKNWRTWKAFAFVFFFAIPTDEILWSAAIALPYLARIACGTLDPFKEASEYTNPVHRRLGYTVCILFSFIYGLCITTLLKVPFFAPTYGLFIGWMVGFGSFVLAVKTEKLVAGVVFKAFLWIVMLLWLD